MLIFQQNLWWLPWGIFSYLPSGKAGCTKAKHMGKWCKNDEQSEQPVQESSFSWC